ncbi:BnaC05g10880D [Brassica napus]|uniref:BnaC05g10880D protein n=1 Tax=Brassica napus TaxID=3708 RepID=A0A078HTB6_BRANA|nr:BnaC05g10880D [Brassica napus]
MNIWKRASVALKDGTSLIAADDLLKAAVVKATNHDEYCIDPENALFIYRHVRATPASLKPLISAISSRVTRTRSWVVALKGLMLMHGFFLSKTTAAESIGRLPFDLSAFGREGNSRTSSSSRSGGFNLFVRAYFAFLDRRSILFHDGNRHRYDEESSVMIRLVIIRKMQVIIDSLVRIKPIGESVRIPVINEAMENVISEILEIYGWICRRIAEVLPNVNSKSGKRQADVALKIVAKSMTQGEELVKYFVFCRDLGVANAQEIPNFVRIPVDDVIHLHEIVWTDKEEEQGGEEEPDEEEGEEEMERELIPVIDDLIKLDDDEAMEDDEPPTAPPVVDVPDLISL